MSAAAITIKTIRERLEADKVKTSRLATWEEIEYLLNYIDELERITDAEIETLREALGECDHR